MKLSRVFKVVIVMVIAVIVMIVVLPVIFSEAIVGIPLPPLQLPPLNAAVAPDDTISLDGVWTVGNDSQAGFRVQESFLLQTGILVGRTNAVTGSLDI